MNNQSLCHQDLSNPSPITSPGKSKTDLQIPDILRNDTHATASIITLDSNELNGQTPDITQPSKSSFEIPFSLKFSRPFYFRAFNFRASNFRASNLTILKYLFKKFLGVWRHFLA